MPLSHGHSQVLAKPVARRESTRPVLRSGHKWPCATLHRLPALLPAEGQYAGEAALSELSTELARLERTEFPLRGGGGGPAAAAAATPAPVAAAPPAPAAPAAAQPVQVAAAALASAKEAAAYLPALKKGATDLKKALGDASKTGALLLVAYVDLKPGDTDVNNPTKAMALAQAQAQLLAALQVRGSGMRSLSSRES